MTMIRVLLADDHKIVREGLRRIIEESSDLQVVAEAGDGNEAVEYVVKSRPHVAVIDISMPGIDGLEVINRIQAYAPGLPVLVLTMHEEEQYVVRAIRAGAMGYVTKRSASEELVEAIRRVHAGGRYLTGSAAESLALRLSRGGRHGLGPLDALSNREIQVLRRLALGQTNREIAEAYFLSTRTVDTYRSRLLKKLNLRNNAELSRFAIQSGLVEP